MNSFTNVGWIGTGVMGKSMCKHLINNKYKLTIFTRTKSKCEELIQMGAIFADIESIAKTCNPIFIMPGFPNEVESVIFDKNGLYENVPPKTIIVDHSTNSPTLSQKIWAKLKEKEIEFIDAPVTGGDVGARNGKLVIMCGGNLETYEKINPLMKCYGANIKLMGKCGLGQHTKMANQIMIAGQMIGVIEGLIYGYKAGLNLKELTELLATGSAGSFSLSNYAPRMLKRDFDPGFYVEHFVKDLGLVIEECRNYKISLPSMSLVYNFYLSLMAHGGAKLGTQALLKTLENLNNLEIPKLI